jgi:CRISPR/Cas system-associated exonuclease Cas4 (RecB family)
MSGFFKPMILAWSYSRLTTWEDCPAKAKYKFLDKLPEEDSPYAARGLAIHKMAEEYITGKVDKLAPELEQVDEFIEPYKGHKAELQIAFTKNWEPCPWFGPQVYCRVVIDALRVDGRMGYVADHKTGKKREDEHKDQLRLYGLAMFLLEPTVEECEAQIIYVDHGERMRMTFHRNQMKELAEYWDNRAGKMTSDDVFSPRPGPYCRWCSFSKSKGGPCIF